MIGFGWQEMCCSKSEAEEKAPLVLPEVLFCHVVNVFVKFQIMI